MKITLPNNKPYTISLTELADQIYEESKSLQANFTEDDLRFEGSDFSGTDCRLQVCKNEWFLHTGDSQYDTDHRGYWACSSIPYRCTREQSREIARELIEGLE